MTRRRHTYTHTPMAQSTRFWQRCCIPSKKHPYPSVSGNHNWPLPLTLWYPLPSRTQTPFSQQLYIGEITRCLSFGGESLFSHCLKKNRWACFDLFLSYRAFSQCAYFICSIDIIQMDRR